MKNKLSPLSIYLLVGLLLFAAALLLHNPFAITSASATISGLNFGGSVLSLAVHLDQHLQSTSQTIVSFP
jgi:hypothetical protein